MKERYYLWGLGNVGKRALKYLSPLKILDGIIDSDPNKWGQTVEGLEVVGYNAVKPLLKDSRAGVIIAYFVSDETEKMLEQDSVTYYRLNDFVSAWYREKERQCALGFVNIPVTVRCPLNCKDCFQFVSYREKKDVPPDVLKRELAALFKCVSFVGEVSIIGGEPFLHKGLADFIEYIAEGYGNRIGNIVITTNGMVMPDAELLEVCREFGIFISLSDYSETLPHLEGKIADFQAVVEKAGVKCERKRWNWSHSGWVDPGKFNSNLEWNGCPIVHTQLLDGKLWRCELIGSGYAAGLCEAKEQWDYCDLFGHDTKSAMKAFLHGDNPTQRTSQCRKCLFPKGVAVIPALQIQEVL